MIEFNDIDFKGQPPIHHDMPHHDEPHHHHCPPPLDPVLKGLFDFINHVDRLAHKALDVASMASMDASSARKLAEQTSAVLSKVSALANKADIKASNALADISIIKLNITNLINELSKIKAGAGLNSDGTYKTKTTSNYINDATSLDEADLLLDSALKETNDTIDSLIEDLGSVNDNLAELETRLAAVEEKAETNRVNIGRINQDIDGIHIERNGQNYNLIVRGNPVGTINSYIAGPGMEISGNQLSIKIDPASEKGLNASGTGFLSAGVDGLRINGIIDEIDRAYVAGEGLERSDIRNEEKEWVFKVKVAQNSTDYLDATTDGLELNIDALRDAIGEDIDFNSLAGEHLQYDEQAGKLNVNVQSLVADQDFVDAVTSIVNNAMLWESGQNNQIQPKDNKDVYVAGKITATGSIYSEEA